MEAEWGQKKKEREKKAPLILCVLVPGFSAPCLLVSRLSVLSHSGRFARRERVSLPVSPAVDGIRVLAATAGSAQAVVAHLAHFQAPFARRVAEQAGEDGCHEGHAEEARRAAGPRQRARSVSARVARIVSTLARAVVEKALDEAHTGAVLQHALGRAHALAVAHHPRGKWSRRSALDALTLPAALADQLVRRRG